eukprot:symbB.v1.2.038395.t1/scaffold5961.1/size22113/1
MHLHSLSASAWRLTGIVIGFFLRKSATELTELGLSPAALAPRKESCRCEKLEEAQQALVAADGLSRDSGDGASTPQGVEPAELPEPSVEAVPGEVKEDTEKPEGPTLTVENILAHAVRVDADMQAARAAMGAQSPSCDIFPNDGIALLATSDLADAEAQGFVGCETEGG